MKQFHSIQEVRAYRKSTPGIIGFVPTMGNLHEGHLALVRQAKAECDAVVVSIFVNPKQFNSTRDLEQYPRTYEDDLAKLKSVGADSVFYPSREAVYPADFSTTISSNSLTHLWEGEHRPGHFDGVCTVVAKLFNMVQADRAYFGEKDYQQLQVVKAMARDLNIPIEIVPCPTVREIDGLALSSRNSLIDPKLREKAPLIKSVLDGAKFAIGNGSPVDGALQTARDTLVGAGFIVEYFSLVNGCSLEPIIQWEVDARLLVAAQLGDVRLIDNIAL